MHILIIFLHILSNFSKKVLLFLIESRFMLWQINSCLLFWGPLVKLVCGYSAFTGIASAAKPHTANAKVAYSGNELEYDVNSERFLFSFSARTCISEPKRGFYRRLRHRRATDIPNSKATHQAHPRTQKTAKPTNRHCSRW